VELVRHHFDHEENVLFPIAATLLDEESLAELAATWAERRGVEIKTLMPIEPSATAVGLAEQR
jgi:hemerythrin-like domain-containing protein